MRRVHRSTNLSLVLRFTATLLRFAARMHLDKEHGLPLEIIGSRRNATGRQEEVSSESRQRVADGLGLPGLPTPSIVRGEAVTVNAGGLSVTSESPGRDVGRSAATGGVAPVTRLDEWWRRTQMRRLGQPAALIGGLMAFFFLWVMVGWGGLMTVLGPDEPWPLALVLTLPLWPLWLAHAAATRMLGHPLSLPPNAWLFLVAACSLLNAVLVAIPLSGLIRQHGRASQVGRP